jgi:hypothetical protein
MSSCLLQKTQKPPTSFGSLTEALGSTRLRMESAEIFSIVTILAGVQAVLAWWMQARITGSIKHEYDKKLEDFKQDHLRREKAAVIAEFLAEWTHLKGNDTKRLNQLLWELTLYLPSSLVKDVKSMSTNAPGCKTAPDVLVAARNHLLNGLDPIQKEDVTHFHHPDNASMRSNRN